MGVILTALSDRLSHPDPLTSTGHFLSPAEPGPAEISVNVIKEGRSLSTAQAILSQNGRDRVVALATFGSLSRRRRNQDGGRRSGARGRPGVVDRTPDPISDRRTVRIRNAAGAIEGSSRPAR